MSPGAAIQSEANQKEKKYISYIIYAESRKMQQMSPFAKQK